MFAGDAELANRNTSAKPEKQSANAAGGRDRFAAGTNRPNAGFDAVDPTDDARAAGTGLASAGIGQILAGRFDEPRVIRDRGHELRILGPRFGQSRQPLAGRVHFGRKRLLAIVVELDVDFQAANRDGHFVVQLLANDVLRLAGRNHKRMTFRAAAQQARRSNLGGDERFFNCATPGCDFNKLFGVASNWCGSSCAAASSFSSRTFSCRNASFARRSASIVCSSCETPPWPPISAFRLRSSARSAPILASNAESCSRLLGQIAVRHGDGSLELGHHALGTLVANFLHAMFELAAQRGDQAAGPLPVGVANRKIEHFGLAELGAAGRTHVDAFAELFDVERRRPLSRPAVARAADRLLAASPARRFGSWPARESFPAAFSFPTGRRICRSARPKHWPLRGE